MKEKSGIILLVSLALLFVLWRLAVYQTGSEVLDGGVASITYNNATTDNIKVTLPPPGAVTSKEFSVTGEARGTWFFEASFPVVLLDKDGNVLVQTHASYQPEPDDTVGPGWMTENFVPFKADIEIPINYTGKATLVLKKDNPSGLAENDASISFPITIAY